MRRNPGGPYRVGAMALVLAAAGTAAATAQQAATVAAAVPPAPLLLPLLVFDDVTVVDVEHGKLLPGQRVVLAGNRIRAVGARNTVEVPKDAHVVDARNKYLIPGLWDMHVHVLTQLDHYYYPLFIANGVTGIRDAFSDMPLDTLTRWWRETVAGTRVGPPRQLLTGTYLNSEDPREAQRSADSLKALGATFLKVRDFTFAAAQAARRVGLPFGGHLDDQTSVLEASDSGISIIDHVQTAGGLDTLCVGPKASVERCRPVVERFQRNGTWWAPTLIRKIVSIAPDTTVPDPGEASMAIRRRLSDLIDRFIVFADTTEENRRTKSRLPPDADSMPTGNWLRGTGGVAGTDSLRLLSIAQGVGMPIVAGSDVGWWVIRRQFPGFSLHAELAILVAEGLTPLAALQAATLNPAKVIHATDSLGTVAPGKLADLVLLDGDPLADITNITLINAVVANGRYFDRATLDQLLAKVLAEEWWGFRSSSCFTCRP